MGFVVSGAQALSEDFTRFKGLIIGCGEASALVIDHIVKGTPLSYQALYNLIADASASGHLDWQGVGQTASAVQWDLQHVAGEGSQVNYGSNNLQNIIESALSQNKPVIIGVNDAQASLTGEVGTGVMGHYIAVVGENSQGNYIVADPNTSQAANGGFVNDTIQQLLQASPFASVVPNDAAQGGTGNPIGGAIGGGLSGILGIDPASLGQGIAQGIAGGISSAIEAPFKSAGVTGLPDFLWRTAFILLAIILIIVGIIGLFHNQFREAGETAAKVAPLAAA